MKYKEEAERLKTSHWPTCDKLAADLASRGKDAGDALVFATKSRVHHVRSASLRALASIDAVRGLEIAKSLLADRAYEVRETAQEVINSLT